MRQYVARPGQECKSELIVGAELEPVRWTAWYFQCWCLVQWNQGRHQRKMVLEKLRCLLKTGNIKIEETWQLIPDTRCSGWTRIEVVFDVLLNGAYMVVDEEDRSDREGVYFGGIWARCHDCWWCSTLKTVAVILKLIRWRTGSQRRPARTGVMWEYRDFCATTRARVFWTIWRRARFDADVPARWELQ